MKINPHLNFNGECAEAFKFYERVLGGKIIFAMKWGEMPGADQFPPETHNLMMHTTLSVGEQTLMGADSPPGRYERPKGITVAVHVANTDEGKRVFAALSEKGNVTMPFEKTFWSPGFGMCVDRFGIPWMVNTEEPANR